MGADPTGASGQRQAGGGQAAIDGALAAIPDDALDEALEEMLAPLLLAVEGASGFEDALARAANALPHVPVGRLSGLLEKAMFGAEAYGRLEP